MSFANVAPSDMQVWFKSRLFEIIPGEDLATNPGRYGKSLADWLASKLPEKGYEVQDVIPEDWGWCIVCKQGPVRLWVGCGAMDMVSVGNQSTPRSDLIWTCFVEAHVPFFARWFGQINQTAAARELFETVKTILGSEPEITIMDQP